MSNSVWIHGSSVLCLMCFLQKEGHQCPRVPGPEQGDSFINGTPDLALLVRILCQSTPKEYFLVTQQSKVVFLWREALPCGHLGTQAS